jgi:hypothetical protein
MKKQKIRGRKSLDRRPAHREQLLRILVVCGGKISEPKYLAEVKKVYRNNLVQLTIVAQGQAPINVVQHAAGLRNQAEQRSGNVGDTYLHYDEVWCVLDVDDHASLRRAKELAQNENILLAISNPCFELWLLLHFVSQMAAISTKDVQRACLKHMPTYKKEVPFLALDRLYPDAVKRAKELEEHHSRRNSNGGNPSTEIYKIIEKIRRRPYQT